MAGVSLPRTFAERVRTPRSVRPLVVALAAGLLLASCQWPQVGFGPEHRRHNTIETDLTIDNVASLAPVWSTAVPGARTEPIVADGRVYVTRASEASGGATGGVWVRALDAASGGQVWERELATGPFGVILSDPNARFGSSLSAGFRALAAGNCVATHADLDPATGSGTILQDDVVTSPAVKSGSVVVRTSFQMTTSGGACQFGPLVVRATDVQSGTELWRASEVAVGPGPMPTVADGRVLVTNGSTVEAFALGGCGAATCSPLWSAQVDALDGGVAAVAGEQGQIFVRTDDGETGHVVALSARNGAELWRGDVGVNPFSLLGPEVGIAVAGELVYVTTPSGVAGSNRLRAFAAEGCGASTCSPVWTATIGNTPSLPVIAGGVIYVGTVGSVQAYDATGCGSTTCSPIATIPTSGFAGNLSIAGGKLFVAGGDTVTAFAPAEP